jgi:hypothetical protein
MSVIAFGLRLVARADVLAIFCLALRLLAGPARIRTLRSPGAAVSWYARAIMSAGATIGIGLA